MAIFSYRVVVLSIVQRPLKKSDYPLVVPIVGLFITYVGLFTSYVGLLFVIIGLVHRSKIDNHGCSDSGAGTDTHSSPDDSACST